MWKFIEISSLVFVGIHAVLWCGLVALDSAIGLSDQSPVYILVVIVHVLDSPTRWLLSGTGLASNQGILFSLASFQWAVIGAGLGAMVIAFYRRKRLSRVGEAKELRCP